MPAVPEASRMADRARSEYRWGRGRSRGRVAGRVCSALFFFPRGGSAQVARSLARALPAAGWRLTLAAGSLGGWGEPTHAASFFAGVEVEPLDYSPALERAEPLVAPVPFPPSYEDRPGAPDRVFAAVGDARYERLVAAWIELLARAGAGSADLEGCQNPSSARNPSFDTLHSRRASSTRAFASMRMSSPSNRSRRTRRRLSTHAAGSRHCRLLARAPEPQRSPGPNSSEPRLLGVDLLALLFDRGGAG
jgi:hypothetical protein